MIFISKYINDIKRTVNSKTIARIFMPKLSNMDRFFLNSTNWLGKKTTMIDVNESNRKNALMAKLKKLKCCILLKRENGSLLL
jgi:hypothetical protein